MMAINLIFLNNNMYGACARPWSDALKIINKAGPGDHNIYKRDVNVKKFVTTLKIASIVNTPRG